MNKKYFISFTLIYLMLPHLCIANSNDNINMAHLMAFVKNDHFTIYHLDKINPRDVTYRSYADDMILLTKISNSKDKDKLLKYISNKRNISDRLIIALGDVLIDSGDYAKALEYYEKLSTTNKDILFQKAYVYILNEKYDEAIPILDDLLKVSEYKISATYYRSFIHLRNDQYEKALKGLLSIKDTLEYKEIVPYLIMECYVREKQYDKVFEYIDELEDNNITFQNADVIYSNVADAYLTQQDYKNAIIYYEKANRKDNDTVVTTQPTLAPPEKKQLINDEDFDALIPIVNEDEILTLDEILNDNNSDSKDDDNDDDDDDDDTPNKPDDKVSKKETEEKNNVENVDKKTKETTSVDNQEKNDNDDQEIYDDGLENISDALKLGYCYYKDGRYDEAIEILDDEDTNIANYYLGLSYLHSDKLEKAVETFDKVFKSSHEEKLRADALMFSVYTDYQRDAYDNVINKCNIFKHQFDDSEHIDDINDILCDACDRNSNYDLVISNFEQSEMPNDRAKEVYQKVLLYRGHHKFNEEQYDNAIQDYSKSIKNRINEKYYDEACYWLGESYNQLGKLDEALTYYNKVKGKQKALAQYAIGYVNFNNAKYNDAKQAFKDTLTQNVDSNIKEDAGIRYADCLFLTKNYSSAIREYKKYNNDHCTYYRGLIQQYRNDYNGALNFFNKINSYSKYYGNALNQIGIIYLTQGKLQKANDIYTKLIDIEDPDLLPNALIQRATVLTKQKKYSEACDDYEDFLDKFPQHKQACTVLSSLMLLAKNKDDYIKRYKHIVDPAKLAAMEFERAKNLFYDGSYEQASQLLIDFINTNPKSKFIYEAHYLLGETYRCLNETNKSIHSYNEVLKNSSSPFYIKAVTRLASIYHKANDTKNTIKYYRILSTTSDEKAKKRALINLVDLHYNNKNYKATIEYINKLLPKLKDDQNKQRLLLIEIKSYIGLKKYDIALKKCKAVNKTPEGAYLIAMIYTLTGQYEKSLNTLYDLAKKHPNSNYTTNGYILMAKNYIAQKNYHQAKATLNSIIKNANDEKLISQAKKFLETIPQTKDK